LIKQNWENALKYYRASMKLNYTKNAELNYKFVKNKLDKLKEEEKQKQEN